MPIEERGGKWCRTVEDVTRRLARSASLDEIAKVISDGITALGFGTIWIAVVEDPEGGLVPVREIRRGRENPIDRPGVRMLDQGERLTTGESTIMNVSDGRAGTTTLRVVRSTEPDWRFGLPRDLFESFNGRPFAYSVLLSSRGAPVGAFALADFHGGEPIPDEMLEEGLLPILMCQLGIAMERAHLWRRIDWLQSELDNTRAIAIREPFERTVGELAGGVAHDLNNLSGAVLLALASIQDGGPNTEHLLSRAERATRAIGDLSCRLQRTMGTVAGGVGQVAVDLKQIVEDVAAVVRPLCKKGSIHLDLDLGDLGEATIVMGDPNVIRQAVLSLILGAREAVGSAPPDRRTIEIRASRRADEVALVVHDRDLKFHLSPLWGSTPEPARSDMAAQLRVLVVDDEPEFIGSVQDLLRGKGHEVTSATDPAEAFALAAREPFDLVLMDHGLPRKSGLHLLHALRGQGVASKLVLMTGWDSDELRADCRASHCDRILQKPFLPAEIDRLFGDLFAKA
jgi:CheY-like chemotaxis protein